MPTVTEPDFRSSKEVLAFLRELRTVLEYLDITDLDLEGAMRVDVNISVGKGKRVEIKNIGSLSDIEAAILYEITRQKSLVEKGIEVEMETRHWDQDKKATFGTRAKESEEDYRYFPDPNLPPIEIDRDLLGKIAMEMPELPSVKRRRFVEKYGISEYLAHAISSNRRLAEYFEEVMKGTTINAERAAALIANDLVGWIGAERIKEIGNVVPPSEMAKLLELLRTEAISIKIAKEVIPELVSGKRLEDILNARGWIGKVSGEELSKVIEKIVSENRKAVEDAINNPRAIQFLIGKVMEATNKKADPKETYELLAKRIDEYKQKRRV
ncbi:MAG: hypothetical protein QW726_05760 [Fervidicoccaceae archaeon]